jgi:energy-converting hydrogenase B subunit D
MPPVVELVLLIFLLVVAVVSLALRNLLAAVLSFAVYSFMMALLFAFMGAVDVGFTEAVVGAGLLGVLFLVALHRINGKGQQ